jgi:2-polyprenyl-3-methyl-5-hydroxy-6-metoxy-1,4-benzoquinol methylase
MGILSRILDVPFFYNFVQIVLGMDFPNVAKKSIQRYPHETILEIGCGPGKFIKYINYKKYLGIDMNKKYIGYAKKHYETKSTKFLVLNAMNIPKMKDSFDLIIIMNVTHHLKNLEIERILKRLINNISFKRLLIFDGKPDIGPLGKILEYLDQGNNFREVDQLAELVEKYFKIERAETVRKPYWIYKYPLVVAVPKQK